MSYGLAYGLSAYGLASQLKISTEEAKQQMDAYFARFGGVRDYLHAVVEQARKDGYTSTLYGRRRYLPDLNSDNRQRREVAERAALNAPIQGTAADIIKVAMINVQKALADAGLKSRMLLQVHDELVLEVVASELEEVTALVKDKMATAIELSVPLDVSVGTGRSWDSAASLGSNEKGWAGIDFDSGPSLFTLFSRCGLLCDLLADLVHVECLDLSDELLELSGGKRAGLVEHEYALRGRP